MYRDRKRNEISYLSFRDFNYHLSEIGKVLVHIVRSLERDREIKISDVLQSFSQIDAHIEGIPLFLSDTKFFKDKYEMLRKEVEDRAKKGDFRTPLESDRREMLLIEIIGLLEHILSLIAMGRDSLPDPLELNIPATTFPRKLEVIVRGEASEEKIPEKYVNRTFIIGRVAGDRIGIRRFSYGMFLDELIEAAMDDTCIENTFREVWSSKNKLEGQLGKRASRMHILIYPERESIRLVDISATSSIIDIDNYAKQIIGCRQGKGSPPVSLQLGKINKLWIDPIRGLDGVLMEIRIL
ncbi:MAG: hypothetical protein QW385_00615 [Thermoproteota archaeon]